MDDFTKDLAYMLAAAIIIGKPELIEEWKAWAKKSLKEWNEVHTDSA